MSIFQTLRAENKRTLKLARKLEDATAGEPVRRGRLLRLMRAQLDAVEAAAEETIFPALTTEPATRDEVGVARRLRREASDILRELEGIEPRESGFQSYAALLHEQLRRIDMHEEQILRVKAERQISREDSAALGDRMRRRRDELSAELREDLGLPP